MEPKTKNRRGRRRRWPWLVVAVVALLAYPVGGTLLLSTGLLEKLMRSEDFRFEIGAPAWTLWPGHVHAASARVLVNGDTQFILRANNLLVHVNLFALLHKHLHVTSISGDDVRYSMRVKVESPEGIEKRLAAYPPLEDLPGSRNVVKEEKEKKEDKEQEEKGEEGFTVQIEGIDVHVAELWFMEYHYVGPGTLKGGFIVGPHRIGVGTSVQNLGPGELRFGSDMLLAKHFQGRIEAGIPELNPEEHADTSFLEQVTAKVRLNAEVTNLAPLSAYTKGVELRDGPGPLEVEFALASGLLGKDSRFKYSTPKVGARGKGFVVNADLDVDGRFADPAETGTKAPGADRLPRVRATSKATYVSLTNDRGAAFTVHADKQEHEVVLRSAKLGKLTDVQHARIRFPDIATNDLDDLDVTTGKAPIQSKGGRARAAVAVDVDERHMADGRVDAVFEGLHLAVAGIDVRGNGDTNWQLHSDLDGKKTVTRGQVTLRDVALGAGDQSAQGWWSVAKVPDLSASGLPPRRFDGHVSVRAKNAEPVLKALAGKHEISKVIPELTKLSDLRIRATVHKRPETTDVLMEPLATDLFDVAGRFHAHEKESRFAVVIGGKAVSLGVAKDDSGTTVEPFAREGWLNSKLRNFPKPVDTVHSSQP